MIDFVCFLVFDIGTASIEALPVGVRIVSGLFQSIAVRAAGFAIVNVGALAPAVQFLYIIMMSVFLAFSLLR
jgi:Trk-type K+ transport system membrane component